MWLTVSFTKIHQFLTPTATLQRDWLVSPAVYSLPKTDTSLASNLSTTDIFKDFVKFLNFRILDFELESGEN